MKEAIEYFARCNKAINAQMLEPIETRIESPMERELGGYFFLTLGSLLEHVYLSDLIWMQAFLDASAHGLDLGKEFGPIPEYGKRIFADFAGFKAARTRLDAFILEYASRLDDADFAKSAVRMNRKGERMEKVMWKALLHFFNHQTHHRGQVSAVLDGRGIENNYSNMVFIE